MNRRLACLLMLLAASGGCRACSDCYDYSSPVAPGPYSGRAGRAGSVFADGTRQAPREAPQQVATATEQPEIDYSLAIEPANYEVPARGTAIVALPPVAPKQQASVKQPAVEKPTIPAEPLPPIPNEPTVTKLPPLFVQ